MLAGRSDLGPESRERAAHLGADMLHGYIKERPLKDLALAKSWRNQTARGKENNKLVTPLQVDVHYMRLAKHS